MPKIIERVYARIVPVVPVDSERVVAGRLDLQDLQFRLIHEKWRGRGFGLLHLVSASASRTGAAVPKVLETVIAVMTIAPVYLDPARPGDGDVLGIG